MSLKTNIILTVLAVWRIFEVHTASIASEKDFLNKLDADLDIDERTLGDEITDNGYLPEDDTDTDVDDHTDYYKSAIWSRGMQCRDAFPSLCRKAEKYSKCKDVPNKRLRYIAMKYCQLTCFPYRCK